MKTQTLNELKDKWYDDCLKYNIPVSPSDIEDIIEELMKIKESKEQYYKED